MAEMSNDAFYLCDAQGRFLYVNERALKATGYSTAEMLRMKVPDLNPEYPAERFGEFVQAMENGTAITQFETVNQRKDGTIYPIELSVARVDVGKETYLFGVVRDISEHRQHEAEQRTFTQRILHTLEAERQRVARELHDDVGQAIATVGVLLHTLESTPDAVPPDAQPALAATHTTIRQITESVARLVRDYHPAELLGLGLEDTVRTHARDFARRHALGLRLSTGNVTGCSPRSTSCTSTASSRRRSPTSRGTPRRVTSPCGSSAKDAAWSPSCATTGSASCPARCMEPGSVSSPCANEPS